MKLKGFTTLLDQYLNRSFHPDLAEQELPRADRLLRKALKDPEDLADYTERKLNNRVFRALMINCAELRWIEEMHYFIERWQREHPNDEYALNEGRRWNILYPRFIHDK